MMPSVKPSGPFRMVTPDGTDIRLSTRFNRALASFKKSPVGTKFLSPTGLELTVKARNGDGVNVEKIMVRMGRKLPVQPPAEAAMHAANLVIGTTIIAKLAAEEQADAAAMALKEHAKTRGVRNTNRETPAIRSRQW